MLAPKLRFKEFNDEWDYKLFNEIFEFIKNNSFSRDMLNYDENSKIYNIHYGDILTKYGEIIDFNIISNIIPKINNDISLSKFEDKSYLKNGDIIIADTAEDLTVGKSCEVINLHCKALAGLHTIPCRPKFKFASQYLGEYINSTSYHSQLIPYITGIKVSSISKTSIIKTKIYFPTVKEQEKISELFSLLNKKIELQQRKIEVLKMYKRGLSNKLFNQKANYMFKECFLHMGGTALEKYVNSTGKYKFISIGNYSSDGTYVDNNQRIDNIATTTDKILDKDNLVMVLNDKTSQGNIIGSTILIDKDDLYIYNQRSERIICNNKIIPLYAWCILNSPNVRATIFKKSQGGTQIYINFSEIEKLKLYIPNIKEQDKLSQIYISIVKKIDLEIAYFDNLKLLKKSLLQQMFI